VSITATNNTIYGVASAGECVTILWTCFLTFDWTNPTEPNGTV